MAHHFTLRIDVEVERVEGKFASRDSSYEITSWEVSGEA